MSDKRYSIIQKNFNDKYCYVCGKPNSQIHEVIFGSNRDKSIKYGLCVRLCIEHHTGANGVHNNRDLDLHLKREAQRCFMNTYKIEWLSIFRRNYL